VPSHVLEVGGRKIGAILETGHLSPHVRGQAAISVYVVCVKIPSTTDEVQRSAKTRMLRRIHGRGLLAW
jgi:hypothetical protein